MVALKLDRSEEETLRTRHTRNDLLGWWRQTDRFLRRSVALKILQQPSSSALGEFRKEQAVTAELDHPGIVTIHDPGQLSDGRPYDVMGLIRGRSLAAALADRRTDDDASLLAWLVQLCDAADLAHDRGIVHRDLKRRSETSWENAAGASGQKPGDG